MEFSLLAFFILLSIGVSFICSMLEAVILSVTPSYLASLREKKPKLYLRAKVLKDDIERPLASILTFNTVAHTVGAAGAGAEAQRLFGSSILAIFSALLTLAILLFSEIIPKSIGANSWKLLLPFSVRALQPMILISYPLVWLSNLVSSFFRKEAEGISRDEIAAIADIGLDDGAIQSSEHRALKGLIKFDEVPATEILTPAEQVQSIRSSMSLEEAYKEISTHPFSRIIVLGDSKDDIRGYVLRNRLLQAHIDGSNSDLSSLTLPLTKLPSTVSLPKLLKSLLRRREHISAIMNADQQFVGVITLEDLIEHMLDMEIYDEQDHLNPS